MPTLLLRLSRTSFWLAAAVAALGLVAPAGHETLLLLVTGAASLLALGLWRSALHGEQRRGAMPVMPTEAPVLDESLLRDAASQLVRDAEQAASPEQALHAVARILRSELGARTVAVHEVHDVNATHARLSDLIESQPGFRTVARRVRLDETPLAQALRERRPVGQLPDAAALPVLVEGRVIAAIELTTIDLPVDPDALAGLLELAAATLSQRTQTGEASTVCGAAGPAPGSHVLVIEHNAAHPEATAGWLRRSGCRVTLASGMLEGIDALRGTQFDLVLVDLPVPDIEASDAWHRWRRERSDAGAAAAVHDAPVIALSVPGAPGAADRFRELGFDDHLFKPIRHRQVVAMLSRHWRPHAPTGAEGSAAGGTPPTLDPVALGRLSDLDPKGENRLLERVLQAFQASVARLRPQLDAARASGDRPTIRLVTHTLKSSSASIGAMQLSQLCARIEGAIRLESEESLEPQLDALDVALAGALQAIAALLKERE